MIGVAKPSAINGVFQKVASWLAFLNGHRVGASELRRLPSLSTVELESVRQIYAR